MTAGVALRDRTTIYSRFGDWLAYLGLAVTAVALGARGFWRTER